MSATSPERTGVLVIRVWIEASEQPRARITASLDIASKAPATTLAASSVDEVCTIIRNLLTDFLDR